MKEIKYQQQTPQYGELKGVLRIIGKMLYFKFNQSPQLDNMIQGMKQKGATIEKGNGWIRVNIFTTNDEVKLGDKVFNVNEISEQEVENILYEFYLINFTKAKFICS